MPNTTAALYAGIDLGTSGCRLVLLNAKGEIHTEQRVVYPQAAQQTPALWWNAVQQMRTAVGAEVWGRVAAIAVDGTSGTVLLTDANGEPTTPALMYNDARAHSQAQQVVQYAPCHSGAHGTSSSLAKVLWLLEHYPAKPHAHILHQADWIAGKLSGHWGYSDENNCLKLGYDPQTRQWPAWLCQLIPSHLLPKVLEPGQTIANSHVKAGTTDSIAAFMATGAQQVGDAVTSLGSTIALKIISKQPVFAPEFGIYSHRLGHMWLAGGASNSGGAVLLQHFSREALAQLTTQLQPELTTGLDYYPLPSKGERFPVAEPNLEPRLQPRPADDVQFLQGMLEGMSQIEWQAWQKLHELGVPLPKTLRTVGGGSHNPAWMQLRQQLMGIPMLAVAQDEAAYGAALLAWRGLPSP